MMDDRRFSSNYKRRAVLVMAALWALVTSTDASPGFHDQSVYYTGTDIVDEGHPFSIKCTMNVNGLPEWTVDGRRITEDNDFGYALSWRQLDASHIQLTLEVMGAQLYHQGEYRCNGYSRNFHSLRVLRLDYDEEDDDEDETKRKATSNDQILQQNETITLLCTSAKDDDIPVNWYKNGRRIVPELSPNMEITRKYLVIHDAQEEDAGEYMCTVEFAFQTGLTDIGRIFQIKSPARVMDFPTKQSIKKSHHLTLTCETVGFPPPKVSWYKNNLLVKELVQDDPRIWVYTSGSEQQKASLTIRDVDVDDRGLYTCRAENSLDGGETTVYDELSVFVHVRENMIETNEDEPGMGKLLVIGEELVLQCNTTECSQCRVVWFKDDKPIVSDDEHIHIYDENNSIIIHKATYDDSGVYVCAIDREQLDIALNASILVQSEIKLEKFSPASDVVVQGHKFELRCFAKGAPKPTIKWYKENEEIDGSHQRIKLEEHEGLQNGKLVIEEAEYEDRAHYTCEAFNRVNSVNTTIFIRIKDRLAALWPFLGICGEVAILCTIIFAYERKKSAQCSETETDLPAENRNVRDQNQRGQDVRQRK